MITILGGKGYVGSSLYQIVRNTGISSVSVSRDEVNYCDPQKLKIILSDLKASFVVNAAGFTGKPNVDVCESSKYECLQGNAVLPGIIREVCEDLKIPWGHISSGCIKNTIRAGSNRGFNHKLLFGIKKFKFLIGEPFLDHPSGYLTRGYASRIGHIINPWFHIFSETFDTLLTKFLQVGNRVLSLEKVFIIQKFLQIVSRTGLMIEWNT